MTKTFMNAHATGAAVVAFRPKSARLPDWWRPLATLFFALHESRRRQAERHLARHQTLLDRYARPAPRDLSTGLADDKIASA
jgi:hypothetical protein